MINALTPRFVAIVGWSGSGKSWLSGRLQGHFANQAACVSLDDFYRDQSYLAPGRRAAINFDHPKAVDWDLFQNWMSRARAGRSGTLPRYDFSNHTRMSETVTWQAVPLVLVEGLWLLWRAAVRRLFDFSIFVDCPGEVRLQRREARDVEERGRTRGSVRTQFRKVVAPMHDLYVAPQARWADMVLAHPIGEGDVYRVAVRLTELIAPGSQWQNAAGESEADRAWRICNL